MDGRGIEGGREGANREGEGGVKVREGKRYGN